MNNGVISVHRCNAILFAECTAVSVNNCMLGQFSNGYNIRIRQLDRIWPKGFDQIESMAILLKINNALSFLTKNDFIAGQTIHQVKWLHGLIV